MIRRAACLSCWRAEKNINGIGYTLKIHKLIAIGQLERLAPGTTKPWVIIIKKLGKKLELINASEPIHSAYGVGYKLEPLET
jgi:hypothetical protein